MSKVTLNTNIASLSAQRSLGATSRRLSDTAIRLSSGQRINQAADDAAGLSISLILNGRNRVYNQGIRNLNDGISRLNIAAGALDSLSSVVTRIAELAEQAANGTFGDAQRNAIQTEVTSLENEYNRIIRSTSFNDQQLLTGTTTQTVLQGGIGNGGQLSTQIGEASLGITSDPTRAGLTTRLDSSSSGTAGNGASSSAGISADGRYAVFSSTSTNLVTNDTNGQSDAFVKDLLTGETRRLSTSTSGVQGNGMSQAVGISADGRYALFYSTADNLVSGDTNLATDLFTKDLLTGETRRVSTDSSGSQANGSTNGADAAISADGRFISFSSNATNLSGSDSNGAYDVFVKDTISNETRRVSVSSSGAEALGGQSIASGMSTDGRYVSFTSAATNLVAGDTNGFVDLFVRDMVTGVTTRANTSSSGAQANGDTGVYAKMSADGRYVFFSSEASNLVTGDTNSVTDAFIKDLTTGEIRNMSTSFTGQQGDNASIASAVSADGRYLVVSTYGGNLLPGDGSYQDFVLIDQQTGERRRLNEDSSGVQFDYSFGDTARLSADGRVGIFTDAFNAVAYARNLSKAGVQEISGMVVSNQASARITLSLAQNYLQELSLYRGAIGAQLSRTATFMSTLHTASDNYNQASSRITDADVAEESAALVRDRILQQVTAAVLAQANQQPALLLGLLS